METIKTFDFNENNLEEIKEDRFASNWPTVYIIENGEEFYIGETVYTLNRIKQHLMNPIRRKLNKIHVIIDSEYNKSVTLDIESSLIEYMSGEGKKLQNGNAGLTRHNYYDRERYQVKFEKLWKKLMLMNIVQNELFQLRNKDLFKYSPYKALTEDQLEISQKLIGNLKREIRIPNLVIGGPGTGKSILAVYLAKYILHDKQLKNLKFGLVVPMTSFRHTLKKVFKNIPGLKSSMILGPSEVVGKDYDLIIVDEAHRLKTRKNLNPGEYKVFDKHNDYLGIKGGNQLDWIFSSSKYQILFYDEGQSVRPSDLNKEKFEKSNFNLYKLKSQLRVKGGTEYMEMIEFLLNNRKYGPLKIERYDFKIFEDLKSMVEKIKERDEEHKAEGSEHGLCRMLAGYAWDWKTKKDSSASHDIKIGEVELRWNSEASDWVTSPNSINEVGCIHTIQGYDLNYAGVIIGPELSYDFENEKFVIFKDKYKDSKGKASIENPEDLERYILNIYRVLLTRGIKGTYVYICDDNLREYFKRRIEMKREYPL
jgi:uncharacterized protein